MSKVHIGIYEATRTKEGSCNNCQDRESETVIVFFLKTMTFRLCASCAKELKLQLKIRVKK